MSMYIGIRRSRGWRYLLTNEANHKCGDGINGIHDTKKPGQELFAY